MRVSVICTVLNEGESIRRLMDSLCAQTRPPDEVVIVDGGSRDNTVAVIQEYADRLPVRVLVEPGANISRGRNSAIRAAQGEVIASTDAGVWLEPRWLEHLIRALEGMPRGLAAGGDDGRPGDQPSAGIGRRAVAGLFVADPQTPFEVAMGATVLPAAWEIRPERFLPSSRSVAFTKAAWAAAGGYPEWLDYCEDLVFDWCLLEVAGPFGWAPEAIAHFRPRGSLRAFFRQYFRYARGDGKADLWRRRHAIRYGTYLVLLPGLLALSALHTPLWLLGVLAGGLLYCRLPYRRLWPGLRSLSALERLRAVALVPVIRIVGDVAKMCGYPVGWAWRLRNWSRPEIHWREARRKSLGRAGA